MALIIKPYNTAVAVFQLYITYTFYTVSYSALVVDAKLNYKVD